MLTPALLVLTACHAPADSGDSADPFVPPAQIALREDGWLRGDLHVHTTYSDAWESVATSVDLAEYLAWPEFLAYHPEYEGSGLDFLALSDHRTVEQNSDPDFHSDLVVLVPSEEWGTSGHANVPGVSAYVDHDPGEDGVTVEDVQAGIDAAHAQGALFSPNHPFSPGIMFPWAVRGFDTIEVWNSGWALASPPVTEAEIAAWEASHGPVTAPYARAVAGAGLGADGQTLVWYEALLARGIHVGLVGGSDRHALTLPGFPTTYVLAASADMPGVVDGMRARRTFVARTPASAQVLGEIEVGGAVYGWGDAVPVPAAGAEVTARLRVARAAGGRARLVFGAHVESDEALTAAALGTTAVDEAVVQQDQTFTHTFTAVPGDWLYPVVLEPLFAEGLTEEQRALVLDAATMAAESGDDAVNIATAVAPLVDPEILANPEDCDPVDWEPDRMQCVTADSEGLATFFIPDLLDRAMNAWLEEGAPTDWSLGAVGSAVLFVEE